MQLRALALTLVWLGLVGLPAAPMAAGVPELVIGQEHLDAEWAERLDAARRELEEAEATYAAAQAVAAEAKRDNYPRGEARAATLKAVEDAEKALAEARASFPELLERARVEGVSPGILQRYEDAP